MNSYNIWLWGNFPGSPVVKTALLLQRAWVRSLVRELRSLMPHGMAQQYNTKWKGKSKRNNLFWWLSGKEPANTGDTGDLGSVPGLGRSPAEGNGNQSSVLAWEVPWTEKPGRLQSWDLQESDMTVQLSTSMCICMCVCVYTCVCVYKVELNLFALSLVSSEGFH